MSRNTLSSPCVSEPGALRRLPPPEAWPTFACRRCEAPMRVPFPPSDGLCGACRASDQRKLAKTLEQRLAEAGAPRKYAASTRADWERRHGPWSERPELRRLHGWPGEHEESSWLVLITGRGPGEWRTALGTAVLGEALAQGRRGAWITQSDWLRDIKASWDRRGDESEHVVWRRAADAGALLFDDFGGGLQLPQKTWWRAQITELVSYRESRRLPTIVTAQLDDWRQVGQIHESLVRRMDVPLKIHLPELEGGRRGRSGRA